MRSRSRLSRRGIFFCRRSKRGLYPDRRHGDASGETRECKCVAAPRSPGPAQPLGIRLPPEVNRILYIRNLPYKITAEEMYDIFGKYGPIRQIRVGNTPETRGTAYVVYEDIFDAKNACDHLSGFNVCNRYLVVLYYNANRAFQKMDTKKKEEQLKLLKEKYGINTDPPK
ncbi:splicing factor 3B subunit 6 isoform X1 [Paroedura picta]|uniref:splicing factor 3B subunit 6 isoform X1 n=1 Tax=Paroedura picta TaxID=143630 RepID=UPI004056E037